MKSFIAHQAFNKGDRLTVRRPTWDGYLERRLVDRCGLALSDVDGIDLRDPPVVIAWTGRGSCDKFLVVGRPIVVVDVKIRRGHLAQLSGRKVENGNPLVVNCGIDYTRVGGCRH